MDYESQSEALSEAILALVKGKVDDSHCYRDLVDNLYAYRVKAVNGHGKWDTRKIKDKCRWTSNARSPSVRQEVEKEHVVPMAEIVRILQSLPNPTVNKIYDVIDRFCIYCMVTKDEHRLLNDQYQRTMPQGFWVKNSLHYMDAWLRYKCSGVQVPT